MTEAGAKGLVVLVSAHWPTGPQDTVTPVPGFILSGFSPLVAEVADRCLRERPARRPERTGVLLASVRGDTVTPELVAAALAEGRPVAPLLFYQSNPNAVAGHVAARWGLCGPVVCTAPPGDGPQSVLADALGCAALLIADGDADEVLVVVADQGRAAGDTDHAVALLVGPAEPGMTATAPRRPMTSEGRDQRS
ncbi:MULTISPECIES: beta-ketoacyl synthase chain length factor [unclassified Kitasatospora]|uniref:beta-ketoacyl synthase chain length factor n=1 Tax=unclassified Kitasatospora TaxID=2633591 RepID=UPI0024730974|nr:beta-ketoacyl synthase chain length factor [Kitasatospora sp. MAP12-44]